MAVTSGKRRFTQAEIRGKRIYWLADVTIGGRIYRWSTVDLDITADDGVRHYDGVLDEVSFAESMTLLEVANPNRAGLRVQLEGAAELLRAGRSLRQRGELSRWAEGATYEDRVVKIVGVLRDPVVHEHAIEVSIDAEQAADRGSIPDVDAVVDGSTWSGAWLDASDLDLPYPTIIGSPGRSRWDFDGAYAATPARWICKRTGGWKILLAGHEVAASQVFLHHDDFPSGRRFVVSHERDAAGRVVAVVADDPSGTGAGSTADELAGNPNHEYFADTESTTEAKVVDAIESGVYDAQALWVGWYDLTDPTATGGVVVGGVGIREACDVIRYVMGFSTLAIDDGAWRAAAGLLRGFRVDCTIDEPRVPWEWVSEDLLPLLPVSVVPGPWGLRPVVLRWQATTTDAVTRLDEDAGVVAFGDSIEIDTDRIANNFRLKYGWDARTGAYRYTCRRGARTEASTAKAKGRLIADNGGTYVTLDVASTTPGPDGLYRILFNEAAASVAVSYDSATRTMLIDFNDGTSTTTQIAAAINAEGHLECDDDGDTTVWSSSHPANVDQMMILADEGTAGDLYCAISQVRYADDQNPTGVITKTAETQLYYDPNSANATLEWWAAVYALEHHRVVVEGESSDLEWLQLGDVVSCSSSRLALDDELGHVESVEIHDDGRVYLRILILDDPLRHEYVA